MKKLSHAAVLWVSATLASLAWAQAGSIKLSAPADGAQLDAAKPIQVAYEVVAGPKADHIHLYLDGKEMAVLREAMGTHPLAAPPAGAHEICIKAVTRAHVPTGLEQCHKVTVK